MITVPLDELRVCLSCLITFETLGSVTHFVLVILEASQFFLLSSLQPRNGVYTVGDFMTRKEDLHVVNPTTTVDEGISGASGPFTMSLNMFLSLSNFYTFLHTALELLVENRITGFPVIDDTWKLVGFLLLTFLWHAACMI